MKAQQCLTRQTINQPPGNSPYIRPPGDSESIFNSAIPMPLAVTEFEYVKLKTHPVEGRMF